VPAFQAVPAADEAKPRVGNKGATLERAAKEAARLLREARQPLFAGLATDVEGARAVARLADRCGGVVDHMNSPAAGRNLLVLQDRGWMITTLSEVRNRADLLVVAGSDIGKRFPRLIERCVANQDTLFGEQRRCEVVVLGRGLGADLALPGLTPTVVPCEVSRLHEAVGVLRALVAGRPLQAQQAAAVPLTVWQELAGRLKAARYGVITWAAADFGFPHAELVVQALCDLVKDLNKETRYSGLPLGGSDGDLTVDSVLLWQTGFGSRTSLGKGYPEYDPYHFSTEGLLRRGEADRLVWISSFDALRTPPATGIPTIVLGRAGMVCTPNPAVQIPVGTPGVDHAGHLFRTDRVVALPLRQLRRTSLPSVAEVIGAIEAAL
jgi:formylmethanofuran dehydrogenase subunit B